jgi:hypothetical protein
MTDTYTYKSQAERDAERAAIVADDSVLFAGRVRTNTLHLIAGQENKSRRGTTISVCGKQVSNTHRAPADGEKVCTYCQRGRRATAHHDPGGHHDHVDM